MLSPRLLSSQRLLMSGLLAGFALASAGAAWRWFRAATSSTPPGGRRTWPSCRGNR